MTVQEKQQQGMLIRDPNEPIQAWGSPALGGNGALKTGDVASASPYVQALNNRQAFNSGPAAGTLQIVGNPAENPGMPSGTGAMTVYQQALAGQPQQQNVLYSPDRILGDVDKDFRISDDDTSRGVWQQVSDLYKAGDTAGAQALLSSMAKKSGMTGFYNDDGTYTGMVRGYMADANGSYQPVINGQAMWTGDPETNIWLKPDGSVYTFENGALQNSDMTWSRTKPAPVWTPRTWSDVRNESGLTWGDTFAIKAAHGDFTNPALNTQEGNAKKLSTMFEQPLGMPDENWQKKVSGYDPNYVAELAAAAGVSNPLGGSSGNASGSGYPSGGSGAGQTPYQAALNEYQPPSWEEWQAQNGGGTPSAQPMTAPEAYDPNSDPLWQQFLAQYGNAQAPTYEGDPYQAKRDAILENYGQPWQGSEYQAKRDAALENAANMQWNYDPNTDPVWQALQKQYRREGQRATEDTLGRYAAMTGGMPSTAAVTAAAQAGNRYAAELSDRLPQVYQDAYNRYLQEYQRQLGLSDAYGNLDQTEYARWLDQQGQNLDLADRYYQYGQQHYNQFQDTLDQWNSDRNFIYGAARDNQAAGRQYVEDQYGRYQDAQAQRNYEDERNYGRWRDSVSDARYDQEWAQKLREYADEQKWTAAKWDQYLREYGDQLSEADRKWAYQQMRDAVSDARYEDTTAYNRAIDAWQRQQEEAQLAAKYGDYSGLQGLGIDTGKANPKEVAYAADGSTYKFNSDDALYFTQNAPNGAPGNPTVLRGGDGSIWRKDEYGGVTIEKNGKIYTYSAGQVPAQTSTGDTGSRYRYTGDVPEKQAKDYFAQMKEAGITSLAAAKAWLSMNGDSKLTNDSRNSIAEAFMESLGQGQKYTEDQIAYAREVVSGKYPNADPGVMAWAQQIMSETQGMKFGGGTQDTNHSVFYQDIVNSMDAMVKRGASWDEIRAKLQDALRDGDLSEAEYKELRDKYEKISDNIPNNGTHANGMPRSGRYTGTLEAVRSVMQSRGIEAARETLKQAVGKYIHDYEIDYIMDELGLD